MISISGEIHSSKNSHKIHINRRTGKPFVAKSDASKDDEDIFFRQLKAQRGEWERMTADKTYPLIVCFHFRRQTRAEFDYLNIAQGVADAMQAAGYFPKDSMRYMIPDFDTWPFEVCPKNPGCDIIVLEG